MKKLFLILLLTIVSTVFSFSQSSHPFRLDVNGLYPFELYTDAQMRTALGEPTSFKSWIGDSNGEGRTYHYRYGISDRYDRFKYEADFGGFVAFSVVNPRFKLFGGRLKVGDPLSKLTQLGFGTPIKDSSPYFYYLRWGDDNLFFKVDSSNNIIAITYQPRTT